MTLAAVGPLDVPVGYAVVMTVGAALYVPFYVWRWRVLWERPSPAFDEPFAWWVWGAALWRGYVRALVVVGGVFAVDLVLLLVAIWGPSADAVLLATMSALVLALAIGFALAVTITLFNRPRRLVPPYLRHEPGAIREWLDAWRERHADAAGSR